MWGQYEAALYLRTYVWLKSLISSEAKKSPIQTYQLSRIRHESHSFAWTLMLSRLNIKFYAFLYYHRYSNIHDFTHSNSLICWCFTLCFQVDNKDFLHTFHLIQFTATQPHYYLRKAVQATKSRPIFIWATWACLCENRLVTVYIQSFVVYLISCSLWMTKIHEIFPLNKLQSTKLITLQLT